MDNLYSEAVGKVLGEQAHRVWEAAAILELVSEILSQGTIDPEETGRCMSAVDAAVRILKPVPSVLDCRVTMRKAVEGLEAAERDEQETDHA